MPITRRVALSAGGGLALALAGGFWRVTRSPDAARAPWRLAEPKPADVRLDVFRHAILAPNPHNRQPWLIALGQNDDATILCDLDRRLPETDPFDRQIAIGFGCFLGLARVAASALGRRLEVTPFPEGAPAERFDRRPVAHLRFVAVPGLGPDPLFAHVPNRRSLKKPFDMARPPASDAMVAIAAAARADG